MKRPFLLAPLLALSLSGCAPALLGALMGGGAPPQASAQVTNISRTALDFALNSFDAALYGLDFAMDAGKLQPGSDNAKRIAAAGRKVMSFLGAANAAQKLGNAPTYEAAFVDAKEALDEFRALLPGHPASASTMPRPPLTWAERGRIIHRLETGNPTV
jgi:hypothetical protein